RSFPLLYFLSRRHSRLPRVPYTTLFRSLRRVEAVIVGLLKIGLLRQRVAVVLVRRVGGGVAARRDDTSSYPPHKHDRDALPEERSEEHTSELQSRENLVCRLLLEKKNKK